MNLPLSNHAELSLGIRDETLSHHPSLEERTLVSVDFEEVSDTFALVPREDFFSETLLEISPATLLVPNRSLGILKGPYLMIVDDLHQCFDARSRGIWNLLSWLHFRKPYSFVVHGVVVGGRLELRDHIAVEEAFLRLSGPNKWGL